MMNPDTRLDGRWELAELGQSVTTLAALRDAAPVWRPIPGPVPVAAALRGLGDSLEGKDLDASSWWYRCRFHAPAGIAQGVLRFDGLATLADAWLDGQHAVHSESMFVSAESAVLELDRHDHELLVCCHPLSPALAARYPRPRWRTALVSTQNLRWFRTSLLGRIRSWCPPIAPVGLIDPVQLLDAEELRTSQVRLDASVAGSDGVLDVRVALHGAGQHLGVATVHAGGVESKLVLKRHDQGVEATGRLVIPGVKLWWPHTHGAQPLYDVTVRVEANGRTHQLALGRTGFRTITVDRGPDGRGFGLVVNGVPVFCRGACWTPLDLHRVHEESEAYKNAITQVRGAGMNMLRVGGTMAYESAAFHDACDEQGVLVWQDFMLANLDYPDTPEFLAVLQQEASSVIRQLGSRPSLAVLCGSSELEQQAAMLGQPADVWSANPALSALAQVVAAEAPRVPWVSSSPTGGTLPFHTDAGVTHYYGVGAYRRPFDDARRASVRFASECLAFSHVGPGDTDPNAATWKAGVPRDPGADWDFEDIRDHYLERLFGVQAGELRRDAPDRYLALGRVTTGEVIERVMGEWRRPGSTCRGALLWFLRDLAPGAGWGVIDSEGRPKPAWWYLRRALAPVTLLSTDEGLNGWHLHALNDTDAAVEATLTVSVYREGRTVIGRGSAAISIPARDGVTISADALLPGFLDLTYAYRFGPPGHNLVAARLIRSDGTLLGTAFHWPLGLPAAIESDVHLDTSVRTCGKDLHLTVSADRALLGVEIQAPGYSPADNWFSLEPDTPRTIVLHHEFEAAGGIAVTPLNAVPVTLEVAV